MNITLQKLPKSEVKLTIKVKPETLQKFKVKAVTEISKTVKIPGFRPGHAPYEILKDHLNEDAILDYVVELALPETYSEAVLKEKVQAIGRPKIKIINREPLEYEAIIPVYPEVKISKYDKIEIKSQEVKVEAKDIDEVLGNVQKRHATFNSVDRAAKKGDRVEIDFEGFDEGGASLENTKSKNHPLVIGEGNLINDFEENLIGMKVGEEKEFEVKFPNDYFHKPFKGKKVKFKAKMNKIDEVVLPEWTGDFIKSVTGMEQTLEELRKVAEENLKQEKTHTEKVRRENEFLEKIVELTEVEIPQSLIEEELDGMIEEFQNELSKQGIALDKFLEQTNKKLDDLRKDRRKEAEKRLALRFGLQEIFKLEKIDVTDEEVNGEVQHIINLYPAKERYKVEKEYKAGSYAFSRLENKIRMDKLFERFLGK